MRRAIRLLLRSLLAVLVTATLALAQEAVVTRNVNLRRDPSTGHPPRASSPPSHTVNLLESDPTNGYYHVRTEDREEGWVWGRNIRVLTEGESAPTSPGMAAAPPPATEGAAAAAVDANWEKPVPDQTTFTSEGKTCGPPGTGATPPRTCSRAARTSRRGSMT
jgi:hypothetical protein